MNEKEMHDAKKVLDTWDEIKKRTDLINSYYGKSFFSLSERQDAIQMIVDLRNKDAKVSAETLLVQRNSDTVVPLETAEDIVLVNELALQIRILQGNTAVDILNEIR